MAKKQTMRGRRTTDMILNKWVAAESVMVLLGPRLTVHPCLSNSPMPISNESGFLIFTLDSNHNWNCHVDKLSDRLSGG